MPSKKIRSRKKADQSNRTKTQVYNSLWKLGQEIGDVETLMKKYMRHEAIFHSVKKGSLTKEFIETEMKPIDKELMDKIKLYLDEVMLWKSKSNSRKMHPVSERHFGNMCKLTFVWYGMTRIYDRQQAINKILDRLG